MILTSQKKFTIIKLTERSDIIGTEVGEFFETSCEVKQTLYQTILSKREKSVNLLQELLEKGSADGSYRVFDGKFAVNFIPEMIGAFCNLKAHIMGGCWLQQQRDIDRGKMLGFILKGLGAKTK